MTIFRIPIFLLTIVHDGNWKINAEICSIFVHSIDIFLAKERENVSHWNIMEKVPEWRTFSGVPSAGAEAGQMGKGTHYDCKLQNLLSDVNKTGFPAVKKGFSRKKMKIPPCLLGLVVLVCISVKIGCFGGFCRKSSLFQTRNEMFFTVFNS